MCRRSNRRRWFVAAILLALCAHARGDQLADYLQRLGLKTLLAVHLEQELESAPPEERTEMVERLAGLYAELLEAANDPKQQAALEERARKLLAVAPAASADKLRLELLRGSYRAAERIAEDHRMRLNTPQDAQAAQETFARIVPDLGNLRQSLKEKV